LKVPNLNDKNKITPKTTLIKDYSPITKNTTFGGNKFAFGSEQVKPQKSKIKERQPTQNRKSETSFKNLQKPESEFDLDQMIKSIEDNKSRISNQSRGQEIFNVQKSYIKTPHSNNESEINFEKSEIEEELLQENEINPKQLTQVTITRKDTLDQELGELSLHESEKQENQIWEFDNTPTPVSKAKSRVSESKQNFMENENKDSELDFDSIDLVDSSYHESNFSKKKDVTSINKTGLNTNKTKQTVPTKKSNMSELSDFDFESINSDFDDPLNQ
jgi:hypothetical protein